MSVFAQVPSVAELAGFPQHSVGMGVNNSKEEIEAKVQQHNGKLIQEYKRRRDVLQKLDQQTRVPHLLIEIRSLGFVEVQGKDTGGIYERLSDWLVKNWNVTDRPDQGFILAGSDQLAD